MSPRTLLERERELAELGEWLDAAVGRGGTVALVAGEAGIGKTTLLQEFSRRQGKVRRVLWGSCDALFTPRPLAPLHDIARQADAALARALTAGDRDTIFNAALDDLERGAPALVVLEDMHWADEATLDLLKFLGRRIQRAKALVVISYRDDEVGPWHPLRLVIGELPRGNVRRMQLEGLSESAVAVLAAAAGRSACGLHAATAGNPFFLTEVLAASADTVPVTIRDAVLARALRLAPAARQIAEFVSIVPGRAEAWLVDEAVHPTKASIACCLSVGMTRDTDGALAFRHELARRALGDSLSQVRQQELHAKVLAILKHHADLPPARLAHHADGARDGTEVLRYARLAAAQAASVGSHREAAAHYRLALRYAAGIAAQDRARLLDQLSYECYLTDQIEAGIEARREALDLWRAQGVRLKEGDALRWLSRLNWFAGRRAESEQYAAEAVAVLDLSPPGPELAMAYSNLSQLHMHASACEAAIHWAQRTIQLAEPAGYEDILCHALNNLGTSRLEVGDAGGWADLERSLDIALAHGFQEHAARAYTNLSSRTLSARRYEEGFGRLNAGIEYCEDHDLDSWRLYMLAWRARARLDTGDWRQAGDDAETVLLHPRTASVTRIPALIVLGQLRARRGDTDASSPLEQARELAGRARELQRLAPLAAACAETAWLADDRERIVREVWPVYELARSSGNAWMKGELAVWLWRTRQLTNPPTDVAEPYALELGGAWRAAADMWRTIGCPYECATVLAWHGGESEQLEALAVMVQLGATGAANRLRKQLRASGVRRIPRGSRISTREHPQGLTRREVQVYELLAEGLRNSTIAQRLFLSTKTVDHHVSAILSKLSVPSRAEAVALLRRQRDKDA
jgi:DNA-binding CsgD family transcriptional regulator